MDYHEAFLTLYGAALDAIEELFKVFTVTQELTTGIEILKTAVAEVDEMVNDRSRIKNVHPNAQILQISDYQSGQLADDNF